MHKSFINFRYIGKFTNRPVVSFFCRLVLIVCRNDFSSSKTFRKNTNVDTVIIVISYNWSKNIANFFKVFSWNINQLRRFFLVFNFCIFLRSISFVALLKLNDFFPRLFIYFSIAVILEWFLYFLMIAETAGLIPNLGTISTKYLLKIFANSITEVTTFSFSIKVILFLEVTLFPKTGFTVFQNYLESLILPNSKFS